MRALQATTLLLIVAALGWIGLPTAYGQCALPGACQVTGDLAADCAQQEPCDDPGVCDGPLASFIGRIRDRCRNCPEWRFSAEAIVLQRSTTRSQTLFEASNLTVVEALNSRDMNFPVELGPQLSAIRQIGCSDFAVEVAYFQVDGFSASRALPGDSLMVVDSSALRGQVTEATADYTSAIYMGDINLRWNRWEWLTLLAGFRMGQLNEHYRAGGAGISPGEVVSQDVDAFNHLYGAQLGADATVYDVGGPLKLKGICRAGAFANFASQRNHLSDTGSPDLEVSASRDNHIAFLGEAGVVLTYAITQNLSFRASYEAMWLEGVALAPEQIGTSDFLGGTASVDTSGGIFYHGGGLGLEYRY